MSELLTPVEVCDLLKVKPRTLEDWRLRRSGPELPFVRLGRTVRYREADVRALIERNMHGEVAA
jgi:excisionase family DNA binding protein